MATTTLEKPMLPAELRGELVAGHYNLEQMYRLAQLCQQSGLFEDVTDAAQAFVKIAKGQELGLPPMTAMGAFDVIVKRLFIKPWAIAAKINSCGYGRYTVLEQSAGCCTIRFARKIRGVGWEEYPPVSYTFAEATAHGLVKRSPHWQASPAHMLYQRCMGRGGAMYFPELLAGLEPPPDDTVVSDEQAQQNVIELFGEPVDPTAPPPRPAAAAPAGEAGLPYIARIEAAILASGGQVAPWMTWAERRFKKPREAFSEADWQAYLEHVTRLAREKEEEAAQEPPGATNAPASAETPVVPGTVSEGTQGASWGPESPDLFAREEEAPEEYGP
jgi:hypothetical protein